jgi:hypothetical protein
MKPQDAEFAEFAERFKIKLLVQVVLLDPGNNFFFGKPDDFFFEHELFFGK